MADGVKPRVKVPKSASAGEAITIKTLISHTMESGQRKDKQGNLIGNPVNYRDPRTEGMMEAVFAKVPKAEVFAQTGSQFLSLNTLYQMMSLVESGSPQLEMAEVGGGDSSRSRRGGGGGPKNKKKKKKKGKR